VSADRVPAWWTAADQAELDVLVWKFVDHFLEHRDRCAVCAEGWRWCDNVREALDTILEWRKFRHLLSKAEHLRRELDELNILAGANIVREAA
jgi:hypothetical protein